MLYKDKKIVHGRNLNYVRIAILILYTIFVMAFSVYSLSSPNYFLSLLLILLIILFVLFIIYIRKTKYKFYDETYYIYEDKVIIKRVDKKIEIKISDIDHLETHSEYKNIGDVIIYTNSIYRFSCYFLYMLKSFWSIFISFNFDIKVLTKNFLI